MLLQAPFAYLQFTCSLKEARLKFLSKANILKQREHRNVRLTSTNTYSHLGGFVQLIDLMGAVTKMKYVLNI